MAKITADLIRRSVSPIHDIIKMYDDRADFIQDLESYLQAGMVISNPSFFLMAKPVDKSIDPSGQWYTEPSKCDAWFVRWASGKGCMKHMMETVKPLAHVIFSRVKNEETTNYKIYDWNKLKRRVSHGIKIKKNRG